VGSLNASPSYNPPRDCNISSLCLFVYVVLESRYLKCSSTFIFVRNRVGINREAKFCKVVEKLRVEVTLHAVVQAGGHIEVVSHHHTSVAERNLTDCEKI